MKKESGARARVRARATATAGLAAVCAVCAECALECAIRCGKVADMRTPPGSQASRARPFPSDYKATTAPLPPNIRSAIRYSFALTMWLLILAGECDHVTFSRERRSKFSALAAQKCLPNIVSPLGEERLASLWDNTSRSVRYASSSHVVYFLLIVRTRV